ncbi:MAG: sigma-70 family RNA polymerase sigma factor [Bacteroidetes bacterium]|nr:sigma-70 family RNA polymerase sigma factor [Bacteroidota bacterium]
MSSSPSEVTHLLERLREEDREALDALLPLVYDELHRLAHLELRGEGPDITLRTTALVHEAYNKLVDHHAVDWQGRSHFFGVAARAMRQVVINRARKRKAQKRGGDAPHLTLDEGRIAVDQQADRLVALDEALDRLAAIDERQSRVVECRFFGGMTIEETAIALDVSPSTVKRDWRTAKAWLAREITRMESA